jgi:uncharacterized protein YqeY
MESSVQEQLSAELKDAMKAKDRDRVDAIRNVQSEVGKAKTAPGFTGEVDDALYLDVIQRYVKKMTKVREEYVALGERGQAQADKLGFEVEYLGRWLPDTLDEDATRTIVTAAIAELGAPDPKEAGRVVGHVMKSGREGLDGATVNRLVREELAAD